MSTLGDEHERIPKLFSTVLVVSVDGEDGVAVVGIVGEEALRVQPPGHLDSFGSNQNLLFTRQVQHLEGELRLAGFDFVEVLGVHGINYSTKFLKVNLHCPPQPVPCPCSQTTPVIVLP